MEDFEEKTEEREVVRGEDEGQGDRQGRLEEDHRWHRLRHWDRAYCLLLSPIHDICRYYKTSKTKFPGETFSQEDFPKT